MVRFLIDAGDETLRTVRSGSTGVMTSAVMRSQRAEMLVLSLLLLLMMMMNAVKQRAIRLSLPHTSTRPTPLWSTVL